eukprot:3386249-Rhodomonas_salina.1
MVYAPTQYLVLTCALLCVHPPTRCYAMSGTDIRYAATRSAATQSRSVRYAPTRIRLRTTCTDIGHAAYGSHPRTELAYRPMGRLGTILRRRAVLRFCMVLRPERGGRVGRAGGESSQDVRARSQQEAYSGAEWRRVRGLQGPGARIQGVGCR